MDEQELELFQDIHDSIRKCRPNCNCVPCPQGGLGFVEDSLFIVRNHKIIWAVILFNGAIAFKEVSPEWMQLFSVIIVNSPSIFVEFDRCHKIVEYTSHQDKVLPK
ncbi:MULTISPECIES: hypothetical protein [Desulfosporosinus]|uniref:Uncharacterized protein n=1 Tax=Desulfosporosinus acididurans TaxID=476652 RepID=A0A0J1FWA0_9FIRM|nr:MULTISPECIES: hypothetical protein [Desulfosporosinus]KLU67562.1 hypothetical protein DEAC_c07770 [Desulfosporosinus acididurans]